MPNAAGLRVPVATSAVVLLCLALAAAPQTSLLALDRHAIFAGEVWRLWSGHLVHFSLQHVLFDASTLLLAGAVVEAEFGTRFITRVFLLGMPALSVGLLLVDPDLAYYRGASGVAMLLALVAATALWGRLPRLRPILAILGLGLAVKAVLDASGAVSDVSALPGGIKVVWQAHVLGACMGWACARWALRRRPTAGSAVFLQ